MGGVSDGVSGGVSTPACRQLRGLEGAQGVVSLVFHG